jgi:hypothetical protein
MQKKLTVLAHIALLPALLVCAGCFKHGSSAAGEDARSNQGEASTLDVSHPDMPSVLDSAPTDAAGLDAPAGMDGAGGGPGTGGATGAGGSVGGSGGTTSTGGNGGKLIDAATSADGGGGVVSGGTIATGGSAKGGTTSSGGTIGVGGTASLGGTTQAGGTISTGGAISTGGTSATGGTTTLPDAGPDVAPDVALGPVISSFTATPSTITAGRSAVLTAMYSNGVGVLDNGLGAIVSSGTIGTGNLNTNTTYTLTVTGTSGTPVTKTVTVTVVAMPSITSFTVTPTPNCAGQKVTLTAVFEKGTGTVDNGVGAVTSGQAVTSGALAVTTDFKLTVTNPAGTNVTLIATATIVQDGFVSIAQMKMPEANHAATLITAGANGGKVLLTGGGDWSLGGALSWAQLYNPATRTFAVTGSMNLGRAQPNSVLLPDGKHVLVEGGDASPSGSPTSAPTTGEVFDSDAGQFPAQSLVNMSAQRAVQHTATLLANGTVLITGGGSDLDNVFNSAEVFLPSTGQFSALSATMGSRRYMHAATRLTNGSVLITGGWDTNAQLDVAEIYTSSSTTSGSFASTTGAMQSAGAIHTSTLLTNGKVLLAGGTIAAQTYNPSTGAFTLTSGVPVASPSTATLLTSGKVLLTGGATNAPMVYDPTTDKFTATKTAMSEGRVQPTATLLGDGTVLIAGGTNPSTGVALTTAELYCP